MKTTMASESGGPARRGRGGQIGTTCILVVALFLLAIAMGTNLFFAPKFKAIFADFGAALPAPTLLLIRVSDVVCAGWFVVIPLVVVVFVLAVVLTWLVDYRAALVLGLLVGLLALAYLVVAPLFFILPLVQIIQDVRASGAGP